MPFLSKSVETLNQLLVANALCFSAPGTIQAYGICETMLKASDADGSESLMRYPAEINNDAEAKMIEIDDSYSIILYHRLDSIQNVPARQSYGDGGDLLETANMLLTLFAFRNKVRTPVQDIEALIKDRFPSKRMNMTNQTSGAWLQSFVFRVGNSSFDKLAILQREYTQVALNYPDVMALQMSYRIESTWRRGCLDLC